MRPRGTTTTAGPLDHAGRHHDDAAVGTASAIGAAMEAGTAALGGIGGAKARERARNQNQSEKLFHVFSLDWAALRRLTTVSCDSTRRIFCNRSNRARG